MPDMPEHHPNILIIGNRAGTNIAGSLETAALVKDLPVKVIETKLAWAGPRAYRSLVWRLCGKRPSAIRGFSKQILATCVECKPQILLTMGISPILWQTLEAIGRLGIIRCNYSTDDPWNPARRAPWFLEALAMYDYLFTPRRATMSDFEQFPNLAVSYLPFGYAPEHFFRPALKPSDRIEHDCDVLFAGFGDCDRVPYIDALLSRRLKVSLYGKGWDKFKATRKITRGQADPSVLRIATAAARSVLCLVRRANRDGHSMRSFEVPAVGACMLAEKTAEHLDMFGPDGLNVVYFSTPSELAARAEELIADPQMRERLATNAHALITSGAHTYECRLEQMLRTVSAASRAPD